MRLNRGKYDEIKEGQDFKYTEKRVKFYEQMNKDHPPQMESEGATKYDDVDIPR